MSHTWKDRKRYFLKELWKSCICSFYSVGDPHLYWGVPSWFKRMNRQKRRAIIKQNIRNGNYDCLPIFKKEDSWLWY